MTKVSQINLNYFLPVISTLTPVSDIVSAMYMAVSQNSVWNVPRCTGYMLSKILKVCFHRFVAVQGGKFGGKFGGGGS